MRYAILSALFFLAACDLTGGSSVPCAKCQGWWVSTQQYYETLHYHFDGDQFEGWAHEFGGHRENRCLAFRSTIAEYKGGRMIFEDGREWVLSFVPTDSLIVAYRSAYVEALAFRRMEEPPTEPDTCATSKRLHPTRAM